MGSSPFARTKKAVEHSTAFFVRTSGLAASLPSVTIVTSPQGEYTSPTFGRSHIHRTAESSLDHFSVRSSGLPVSFPSVTNVTSPQGESTSPTFGRSHSHRTAEDSLDHFFQCELGPPGFVPLCLWRDFSPGRIHVSDVWSLAHSQNSRKLPRPLFSAIFGPPGFVPLCH